LASRVPLHDGRDRRAPDGCAAHRAPGARPSGATLDSEARRADLERRIRQASGREVLQAKAERELGLHLPADNEFVLFRVPGVSPARAR
jgi:hypothetical protein